MSKIAHLKVTCPQCEKETSIYVVEDGGSNAKVKCEHCKQIFEFSAGMMYEPVAYVASIPHWAVITKADEKTVFSQAIKCGKCGYEYTEGDSSLHGAFSKTANESENPISAMFLNSPAFKNILGVKVLYKCSSCSKIACSECAPESDGITRKKCPFCESDYTIYSEIKPTAENISKGNEVNKQQANSPSSSDEGEKSKSSGCYIATACYGSYDCTQVLTFRHYRDEYLSQTLVGRLFIKIYYALSPGFAKWLDNKHRINTFIREFFLEPIYKSLKDKY